MEEKKLSYEELLEAYQAQKEQIREMEHERLQADSIDTPANSRLAGNMQQNSLLGIIIPREEMENMYNDLVRAIEKLNSGVMSSQGLDTLNRRRLRGMRARRYGFVDMLIDKSEDFKEYYPPHINYSQTYNLMEQIELLRKMETLAESLLRGIRDSLLVSSDEAYLIARTYYGNVQTAARVGVPGAEALYNELNQYYRSMVHRQQAGAEPTKAQLKRDAMGIIDGTKTGEVVLKRRPETIVRGEKAFKDHTQKNYLRVDDDFNPDL